MASFISALSLLVLILANGCFTLPITEEPFSSSTVSSLNDNFTTSQTNENATHSFNTRILSDNATTEFPNLHSERTITEELNFQTSTWINKAEFEENSSRASRMFEESSTSEPFAFTTQDSSSGLENHQRDYDDLLFTTVESNTEITDHALRSVGSESEDENENDNDKRELQLELTTNYMPSFTSTSSSIAPQLYTSQSSTLTNKYTGFLKDETPSEDEESNQFTQPPKKISRKSKLTTTKKSQVQSQDKSEENTKESNLPIAQLDQEASDKVPNYPDNVLFLEKNTDVVTAMPEELSTTTMKKHKEQKKEKADQEPESKSEHEDKPEPEHKHKHKPEPEDEPEPEPEHKQKHKPEPEHESDEESPKPKKPLNQGKKPSLPEEKESDH